MTDDADLINKVADRLQHEPGAKVSRGEVWISCPFHDENTPFAAFRFDPPGHKGYGILYCQGACGRGWNARAVSEHMGWWDFLDPRAPIWTPPPMPASGSVRPRPTSEALRAWWRARGGPEGVMTDSLLRNAALIGELERSALFVGTLVDMGVGWIPDGYDREGTKRPALLFPWDVTTGDDKHVTAMQLRFTDEDASGPRYHMKAGSVPIFCNSIVVTEPRSDRLVVAEGFKKCASMAGHFVADGSVTGVHSSTSWPKIVHRLPDLPAKLASKFKQIVFAFDPGAEEQSKAAAATIPGGRGRYAPMPMKPDDFLAVTDHDVDALMVCINSARRP